MCKFGHGKIITVIVNILKVSPKLERIMYPKDADRLANSVDADQTASLAGPLGAV